MSASYLQSYYYCNEALISQKLHLDTGGSFLSRPCFVCHQGTYHPQMRGSCQSGGSCFACPRTPAVFMMCGFLPSAPTPLSLLHLIPACCTDSAKAGSDPQHEQPCCCEDLHSGHKQKLGGWTFVRGCALINCRLTFPGKEVKLWHRQFSSVKGDSQRRAQPPAAWGNECLFSEGLGGDKPQHPLQGVTFSFFEI